VAHLEWPDMNNLYGDFARVTAVRRTSGDLVILPRWRG
jgi:hypothetical protein